MFWNKKKTEKNESPEPEAAYSAKIDAIYAAKYGVTPDGKPAPTPAAKSDAAPSAKAGAAPSSRAGTASSARAGTAPIGKANVSNTNLNYMLQFFEPGGVVFYEGEFGSCFYDILQGSVGVYIHYDTPDEKLVATLLPGDYFGEMAIIETCARTATIVALQSQTMVRMIDAEKLPQYAQENPDKMMRIMQGMGTRLNKLTEENTRLKKALDAASQKHPDILESLGDLAKELKK